MINITEKYKNTVFLSDLDGTLLDRNAMIPKEAAEHLRRLYEAGVKVTFATARTIRSVKYILEDIPCPLPVALMNGVLLYSFAEGRYTSVKPLPTHTFVRAAELIRQEGLYPFYYFLDGEGELITCYEEIAGRAMEEFIRERREKYGKPFVRITWDRICSLRGDISPEMSGGAHGTLPAAAGVPIYFCILGAESSVRAAAERCRRLDGLRVECYPDPHADVWYMELFSSAASKRSAVRELRRHSGCARIVAFGDNYNDLPMFEEADEAYAVSRAPEEVRRAADGVVPPPEECGVTRMIASLTGVKI